jgi:hypothetical protein
MVFNNTEILTKSGSILSSHMSIRNKEQLNTPSYSKYDTSLVGYWNFDETTGSQVIDQSNGGNTGSIYGTFALA